MRHRQRQQHGERREDRAGRGRDQRHFRRKEQARLEDHRNEEQRRLRRPRRVARDGRDKRLRKYGETAAKDEDVRRGSRPVEQAVRYERQQIDRQGGGQRERRWRAPKRRRNRQGEQRLRQDQYVDQAAALLLALLHRGERLTYEPGECEAALTLWAEGVSLSAHSADVRTCSRSLVGMSRDLPARLLPHCL